MRKDYYYGGSTGGLKGHKFSLFDGGIRVPAIFSWPAMVPAGQVISEPCMGTDIFPTFINAAGGNASDYEISGCDILPVMTIGARRTGKWASRPQSDAAITSLSSMAS